MVQEFVFEMNFRSTFPLTNTILQRGLCWYDSLVWQLWYGQMNPSSLTVITIWNFLRIADPWSRRNENKGHLFEICYRRWKYTLAEQTKFKIFWKWLVMEWRRKSFVHWGMIYSHQINKYFLLDQTFISQMQLKLLVKYISWYTYQNDLFSSTWNCLCLNKLILLSKIDSKVNANPTWWYDPQTLPALLAFSERNLPLTSGSPHKRSMIMRDIIVDVCACLNKLFWNLSMN